MESLNAADWAILTVVGLSTLLSLLRGFVKEALSLAGWVLAFVIALLFSDRLSSLLAGTIENPTGRYIVSFAGLFVMVLIAASLLARLLQNLVQFAGLGGLDRVLGTAFGFARGVFLVLIAITMLRPALQLEQFQWWQQSVLLPHLLLMEGWFRGITGWLSGLLAGSASA